MKNVDEVPRLPVGETLISRELAEAGIQNLQYINCNEITLTQSEARIVYQALKQLANCSYINFEKRALANKIACILGLKPIEIGWNNGW